MSRFEIQNATGYLNGTCYGKWDISDPVCTKCLVTKNCEEIVKHGSSNQDAKAQEPEIVLTEEDKKLPEISPLEYMFELLSGRFESTTKENDKAVAHYFTKDGVNVFTVIVSKLNGKLKLHADTKDHMKDKILDGLKSIEEAEEIVKEMVG